MCGEWKVVSSRNQSKVDFVYINFLSERSTRIVSAEVSSEPRAKNRSIKVSKLCICLTTLPLTEAPS